MKSSRFPKLDAAECARRCKADGGFTVNPHTGEYATKGYAVAVDKQHECVSSLPDWANLIAIYADLYADDVPANGLIGGWVSQGQLYLDLSELHADRAVALALGLERDQLAIFRLDDSTEIPVNADMPAEDAVEWARRVVG